MNLDRIQMNQLRVFVEVFRTLSMTGAAEHLHLTQSGVSQHMASLEEALSLKLFDRVKHKLIPTDNAKKLYSACCKGFDELESGLSSILGVPKELSGTVSMGMPIEFGNNVIIPYVAEFRKKHPHVKFEFVLDFAAQLNASLLKGDLDFAFVDDFAMDQLIETKNVYEEVLELCILKDLLKNSGTPKHVKKFYESLEYVDYQKGAPILRMWFKHHLKTGDLDLNVNCTVMDVLGISRLILSGAGAGILPRHFAEKLQSEGNKLYLFPGCEKPLVNNIRLARLRDRTQSPTVRCIQEFLMERLRG